MLFMAIVEIGRADQAVFTDIRLVWEVVEHQHPLAEPIGADLEAGTVGGEGVGAGGPVPVRRRQRAGRAVFFAAPCRQCIRVGCWLALRLHRGMVAIVEHDLEQPAIRFDRIVRYLGGEPGSTSMVQQERLGITVANAFQVTVGAAARVIEGTPGWLRMRG
jgi:hypothetical protein